MMYWACSAVTHLRSGWPYPCLYRSSPIMVYLAALAIQVLSAFGGGVTGLEILDVRSGLVVGLGLG